jgi:integrase
MRRPGRANTCSGLLARRRSLRVNIGSRVAERAEFGPRLPRPRPAVPLGRWPAPHPDTITRRFKRLAQRAGLPFIDLHDVRHGYATAARDAKIGWKAHSQRIGHADGAFTMRQYVQSDLEADRQVATALAELIIGGVLASVPVPADQSPDGRDDVA